VENFSGNLFSLITHYIWRYSVLNIRADSSCPPQTVLLSYGYDRVIYDAKGAVN